jgi:hypothetical protein
MSANLMGRKVGKRFQLDCSSANGVWCS